MLVLVNCEESQEVCKAFRALGHEAYSCDLQEPSGGHPEWHLKMDALEAIKLRPWDMMIAFPPCTYLCVAGLHYSKKDRQRMCLTWQASGFFMKLYNAPIEKVAVENPVGYMNTTFRKPDQIIEPYMFGTSERKKTCLWLRGLPVLLATHNDKPKPIKTIIRKTGSKAGQPYNYYWRQGKSAKDRSRTFPCIAAAMSEQWGRLVK